jgi:hypothetical protein
VPFPNVEDSGSVYLPTNFRDQAPTHAQVLAMRLYDQPHRYYCGIDLHARTLHVCVLAHADRAGEPHGRAEARQGRARRRMPPTWDHDPPGIRVPAFPTLPLGLDPGTARHVCEWGIGPEGPLPRGCPRVVPVPNSDTLPQARSRALHGRRGECTILSAAGQRPAVRRPRRRAREL